MNQPARILIAHNTYQQRGGEDSVVEAEAALLRQNGHEVEIYTRSNDEINSITKTSLLRQTLWSGRTVRDLNGLFANFKPQLVHVHNTFPLISPSLYWAAHRHNVPIVQTLHNFRLLCPQAMFLRESKVCEECNGRLPWRAVAHRCYRDSLSGSSVLTSMLSLHRVLGTYKKKVSRYIALNAFCRDRFVAGGLPAERIAIKPNFVDLEGMVSETMEGAAQRSGGLYVGRLSTEKGIEVLAEAWQELGAYRSLKVIGSGPCASKLHNIPGVTLVGSQSLPEIVEAMHRAQFLVMPSIWYENFPRTLVESFACGLPVIASRLGAMQDLVKHGETGLLFNPGQANGLANAVRWAETHPLEMQRMGRNARKEYLELYTPQQNYRQLMQIYDELLNERSRPNANSPGRNFAKTTSEVM